MNDYTLEEDALRAQILGPMKPVKDDWMPSPGVKSVEEGYFGKTKRYSVQYGNDAYEVAVKRTISKNHYKAIISKNGRAVGSFNQRGFLWSDTKLIESDDIALEVLLDAAVPSARLNDTELAKLADMAKERLNR